MKIENITNPGHAPVAGDTIRVTYPDGTTRDFVLTEPAATPNLGGGGGPIEP